MGRDEVDLLALEGETLVCVEVRYRQRAEDALQCVDRKKAARLLRAATTLQARHPSVDLRIDVVLLSSEGVEWFPSAVEG